MQHRRARASGASASIPSSSRDIVRPAHCRRLSIPRALPTESKTMADENRGWTILESTSDDGGSTVYIRVKRYEDAFPHAEMPEKLALVWKFSHAGSGMPTTEEMKALEEFEDRICDAVEDDHHATLSAVFTGAGERAWIFYSRDVDGFMQRLSNMPHPDGAYPIEIDHETDAEWEFHRQFPREEER